MLRCAYSAADFSGMGSMFQVVEIGEVFVIQFAPGPTTATGNGNALDDWAQVHLAEDPVGEQCERENSRRPCILS